MKEERKHILGKDDGLQKDISSKHKYALFLGLTFALCLAFFTVGAAFVVTGPVLLELASIADVKVSVISWVLTARGFGIGVGSLSRGYMLDFSRHRVISSFCVVFSLALSVGAIPWCSNLAAMLCVFSAQGMLIGALEADCNDRCIQIWGKDHAPYLLAVYAFFYVGGLTAPLLATAFFSSRAISETPLNDSFAISLNDSRSDVSKNGSSTIARLIHQSEFTAGDSVQWRMGKLHLIIAVIAIIVGLYLPLMSYLTRHWDSYKPKGESSPWDQKVSITYKKNILRCLFSVYIFIVIGVNVTYSTLLTAFVVKQLHENEQVGSVMTTTTVAVGILGTLISALVSKRVPTSFIILINLVISTCATTLFAIAGGFSTKSVWVTSILLGFTIGTSYSATYSWANQYIKISVKVSSTIIAASTLGEMVFPAITGPFLDTNPLVLTHVSVAGSVICLVVYTLAELLGRRYLAQEIDEKSNIVDEQSVILNGNGFTRQQMKERK